VMKKYRLSTRGAIVDACSGKSGGIGGVRRPVMHNAQCTMHKCTLHGCAIADVARIAECPAAT
jgi:hypothetical protein